jgi:hypothetical protein
MKEKAEDTSCEYSSSHLFCQTLKRRKPESFGKEALYPILHHEIHNNLIVCQDNLERRGVFG